MHAPGVFLVPPSADLPDAFARHLIGRHRAALPDFTGITVLLPSLAAAPHLRRRLAHHAGRGLLGPHIRTLAGFADARAAGAPPRSAFECRLLLAESLKRHRSLFGGQPPARVAAALFELFEELTAHEVDPGPDEAAFTARLQQAYGTVRGQAWLSREAQIVHTLWRAFQEQVDGRSPAALQRTRLREAIAALPPAATLYLVGFDELARSELAIVRAALAGGRAELWLQGRRDGHDGAALAALCEALGTDPAPVGAVGDARSRLLDASFGKKGSDPFSAENGVRPHFPLRLVEAAGAEHEARCVDLAVREALLAGARDVVVLAQDRRLARRLRALLERAQVPLQDHAGWALSTSSAAAALDAWLECLDTRFHFRPLLDLLKSGAMAADPAALHHLEHDLVYGREIERGLDAFAAAAESAPLKDLLQRLQRAAAGQPRGGTSWPAHRWTETLGASLRALGLWDRLRADPAGAQLLRLLGQLEAAFRRVPLALGWDEFRELLDGAIERETFVPEASRSPVRLLTLEQSQNLRCDVLILAGATRERLPGHPARDPFFNAGVRQDLGLPDAPARQRLALARLRRVLEAAPQVIVTYAAEAADEPAQLSPWLEAVDAQATAWGVALRDPRLAEAAGTLEVEVAEPSASRAPALQRPAPPAPPALLPAELTATAHQALLDCPYRFFSHSVLGLTQERAPDEDPDRSDYGRHVHRILQAFTEPLPGLPPPFAEAVDAGNREHARARLEELAQAVFAPELRARALALTWLAEFRAAIPTLVDWLAQRGALQAVRAEARLERNAGGLRLVGRADRLETRADGAQVVVDYKTGAVPRAVEVERGEAVQLLHYALLDDRIGAVEYLPVGDADKAVTIDGKLGDLRERAGARLQAAVAQLRAGAPLPAHGDEATCDWCEYRGVCRREDWHG
jgi:ATP-dependent helicase/nuclease subunit B